MSGPATRRASLAAAVLVLAAPLPARAAGESYRGGCAFDTLVGSPGGQLAGMDYRSGDAYLAVVPLDGAGLPTSATVWCEVRVNGVSQGTVLGPTSGVGVVADQRWFAFVATADDVVSMCTHVVIGSTAFVDCHDATTVEFPPQAVFDAVYAVAGLLNEQVFPLVDPAVCGVLTTLAPAVDAAGRPDVAYVDPATGDLSSGSDLLWDCPPYV